MLYLVVVHVVIRSGLRCSVNSFRFSKCGARDEWNISWTQTTLHASQPGGREKKKLVRCSCYYTSHSLISGYSLRSQAFRNT